MLGYTEAIAAFFCGVVLVSALWLGTHLDAVLHERDKWEQRWDKIRSEYKNWD